MNTPRLVSSVSGVSRRRFVQAASASLLVPAVAAAAGKPRILPHPTTPGVPHVGPIRIGLIGCGGRGTGAATQALRADPDCVLVAMGDVFRDRLDSSLQNLNEEMGAEAEKKVQVPPEKQFTGFDSYQKVIDSGVDVVLLTSYPCFRPQHFKAAVAAGKHVFAEKPVAVDAPGIRSFIETAENARSKGLAALVGFCWRFNPSMRQAFGRVLGGDLGDVSSVYTNYLTGTLGKRPRQAEWSDLEFQMRNWWHFTWIGGDHLVEQAIHSVDRMAWAMGDKLPTSVHCLGGRAARSGPEHGDVFDHFSAVYQYDDGRRCFHDCRQIDGCPGDNTDYITGTKGQGSINGWTAKFPFTARDGSFIWDGQGDPGDSGNMYQVEHNELFASIRSGTPVNDAVRGAHSCMTAIMARMAAYTGQTITWEHAMNSREALVPESLEFGPFPTREVPVPGRTKFA